MKSAQSALLRTGGRTHWKKEGFDMKNNDLSKLKRTLTALLLVFVFSFTPVFADATPAEGQAEVLVQQEETSGTTDPAPGATDPAQGTTDPAQGPTDTAQENAQPAQPAAQPAPAPAPKPVSRIIKKGKYYYYKGANGKIRKKAGFVTDCGKKYYIRKGGKIRTSKSFKVKKKYYRANSKGEILTGIYKWKGNYNYSNAAGQWKKTEGFVYWNGGKYYVVKGGGVVVKGVFCANNLPYESDGAGHVIPIPLPAGDGSAVAAVAKTQVGIMTGKKYWKWYFKTKFKNTDKTPWCGTFVAWCYNAAGEYDKISPAKKYGNLGYVPSYSKFANAYGKWISPAAAKGGDVIVFGRNRHVGVVEGLYGDYIITIEGNAGPTAAWGCGKPGAVCRKIYSIHNRDIKGVIRVR